MSRTARKPRVRRRTAPASADVASKWRPTRQRRQKKRTRAAKGIGFRYELGMLRMGANLIDVMRSAFGDDDAGRSWQVAMQALLAPLPTLHSRRQVLGHFLRWFSGAVRHGSQWRVVDEAGYVGRQHEVQLDDRGRPELDPATGKPKRRHFPGKCPGTLAAYEDRMPRTLNRYRRHLRGADRSTPRGKSTKRGLVACEQPAFWDRDAVVPHAEGSTWAYGQAWLLMPPSPEMVRRWVAEAAEDAPSARARVRLYGLPSDPSELVDVLRELRGHDVPY
jgi:hypothetical protein